MEVIDVECEYLTSDILMECSIILCADQDVTFCKSSPKHPVVVDPAALVINGHF